MSKQIYFPVVGYEGFYEMSTTGQVRSVPHVVTRKDGIKRKVNRKFIRSRKDSGMMLAKAGVHNHVDPTKVFGQTILGDLNNNKYIVVLNNDNTSNQFFKFYHDPDHIPVIWRKLDGEVKRFDNVYQLVRELKLQRDDFDKIFFSGDDDRRKVTLAGSTFVFTKPYVRRDKIKIISHIVNHRIK